MRSIAKFIYLKLLRWKIEGRLPPEVKKAVLVVAPHTSWHDFYIGAFVRKIIGLPIHYVAKKELFDSPFGWYFRWMGGAPIDRSSHQNQVDQIVQMFREKEVFRLTITPEGTRKKVEKWKTGFYHVARQAQVPVIAVAFDFGCKTVKISPPFHTTGNMEKDIAAIRAYYKGVVGKIPEYT